MCWRKFKLKPSKPTVYIYLPWHVSHCANQPLENILPLQKPSGFCQHVLLLVIISLVFILLFIFPLFIISLVIILCLVLVFQLHMIENIWKLPGILPKCTFFLWLKIQTKIHFHFFVTLPTRLRSKSSVSRKSSNSMRTEMHSPEQKIQVKCRPEIVLILCRNPRTREQKIWVAAFVLERSKEICLTWPDGPTQNISVGNAANGSHSHSPS